MENLTGGGEAADTALATRQLQEGRRRGLTRKVRTANDLPVYRTAANILFLLTDAMSHAPRKMVKLLDRVLSDATEMLKGIALANESRGEERAYYITVACANIAVMKSYFRILQRVGIINSDQEKKMRTMAKNVSAQLAGWRDSISREGHSNV